MKREALQDLFIGIAGLIGAGKTTLAKALGEHLDLPVYFEPVADNAWAVRIYYKPFVRWLWLGAVLGIAVLRAWVIGDDSIISCVQINSGLPVKIQLMVKIATSAEIVG